MLADNEERDPDFRRWLHVGASGTSRRTRAASTTVDAVPSLEPPGNLRCQRITGRQCGPLVQLQLLDEEKVEMHHRSVANVLNVNPGSHGTVITVVARAVAR